MALGFFSSWFRCQHLILCEDENSALYGPVRGRMISTSCWLVEALLARRFHSCRGVVGGWGGLRPSIFHPHLSPPKQSSVKWQSILFWCVADTETTYRRSKLHVWCGLSDINSDSCGRLSVHSKKCNHSTVKIQLWGTLKKEICYSLFTIMSVWGQTFKIKLI